MAFALSAGAFSPNAFGPSAINGSGEGPSGILAGHPWLDLFGGPDAEDEVFIRAKTRHVRRLREPIKRKDAAMRRILAAIGEVQESDDNESDEAGGKPFGSDAFS